jgi:hypothetical protein
MSSMRRLHLLLLALLVSSATMLGTVQAASPKLVLTSADSFVKDSTATVAVVENSGSIAVNAVQANIMYPADKLEFIGIDSTAAFAIEAESYGGVGQIRIARGALPDVVGTQTVAIVHFRVVSTGQASIRFSTGTAVLRSDNNTDIVNGAFGTFTCKLKPPKTTAPKLAVTEQSNITPSVVASPPVVNASVQPKRVIPPLTNPTTLLIESKILLPSMFLLSFK